MSSWVRYSIAVYLGLLMAGAFGSIGSFWSPQTEGSSPTPTRLRTCAVRPVPPSVVDVQHQGEQDPDDCRVRPYDHD
jgi:hypothetical protein